MKVDRPMQRLRALACGLAAACSTGLAAAGQFAIEAAGLKSRDFVLRSLEIIT
jgi:hypothetical protein